VTLQYVKTGGLVRSQAVKSAPTHPIDIHANEFLEFLYIVYPIVGSSAVGDKDGS